MPVANDNSMRGRLRTMTPGESIDFPIKSMLSIRTHIANFHAMRTGRYTTTKRGEERRES